MNLYSLTEYSGNFEQTSVSLFQYKRQEQNLNAAENIDNVNENNSFSFKYKSGLLKGLTAKNVAENINPDIANEHRLFLNAQIVVPLKHLCSFFRSLEMPLINCKLHLELNWTKNTVVSSVATASTFQSTSKKLHVQVVTLPTKKM